MFSVDPPLGIRPLIVDRRRSSDTVQVYITILDVGRLLLHKTYFSSIQPRKVYVAVLNLWFKYHRWYM